MSRVLDIERPWSFGQAIGLEFPVDFICAAPQALQYHPEVEPRSLVKPGRRAGKPRKPGGVNSVGIQGVGFPVTVELSQPLRAEGRRD